MVARSSLLRRPTLGARPARRTSSVVAALAALAPRLVRLAHHDYSDRLLATPAAACPSPDAGIEGARVEAAARWLPCLAAAHRQQPSSAPGLRSRPWRPPMRRAAGAYPCWRSPSSRC